MPIGLDGTPLASLKTGIGHYTFELARCLAQAAPSGQFELVSPAPIANTRADELDSTWPANLSVACPRLSRISRRYWWKIGLPLYAEKASYTLFHGTNYDLPAWSRCGTVVTIHDLSLLLHAQTHRPDLVTRARSRLPATARRSTLIITATESVKREICEHLSVEADKVVVTPYAPRRSFRRLPPEQTERVRRRLGVEDEFLLFVGTLEPRKNLLTLFRAFDEILRTTNLRPQLVIVGQEGWLMEEMFSYVKRSGINARLRFTGYLSEEELCALYSSCRVCVYPSLYEGFGLPPLEAMACGAPVIASRIPSLIETAGAARLVAPTDVSALARSIVGLLTSEDEWHHLSAAGLRHVAKFSWERTARLTLEAYGEALRRSGKSIRPAG